MFAALRAIATAGIPRLIGILASVLLVSQTGTLSKTCIVPAIWRAIGESVGVVPEGNTPEEFAAYLKADIAKWRKVIADAKIPKI